MESVIKKKPDDIPFRENKNMYPHPRYELYQSFEIEIKLKLDGEVLFNKSNIIYYGNNKIVEKWNKLRDDLDINKRISENPVKAECDKILKLIRKSKSPNYIIEKYKIKLEDEDYSTELEKQIYIGLIKALIEIIEEK